MQGICLSRLAVFFLYTAVSTLILIGPGSRAVFAQDEQGGNDLESIFFEGGDLPAADPVPEPVAEDTDDAEDEEPPLWDELSITGYVKNETAYRYKEPRSITKVRNILSLSAEYPFGLDYNLFFSGWAYHDLAYDLFDYETITARFVRDEDKPLVFIDNLEQKKDSGVTEIRELYLDIYTRDADIRIGRQFVVWGVLEGIRITDEVNPLDFRELILPDLLDYRVPLFTAKVDYYGAENTYQFLWIPEIKFHQPAPPGSEWELLQEVPNTTTPDSYKLSNSELGLRLSRSLFDAEVSFSYFYTWDDFPVVFRSAPIDSAIDPTFFPTYTRINMYGATIVKQLGAGILKGEFAYVPDKYFGLANDTDEDGDGFLDSQGELQKKHIRWGLGYDFNMWGTDFSPAISQWIILDYNKNLIQEKFDTSLTLFARKPMPQHSAVFQLLAIALLNLDELFLKPEVIFSITDRFQITTGVDLFYGAKSKLGVSASGGAVTNLNTIEQSAQFFGNFNDNDRIFAEFKYIF